MPGSPDWKVARGCVVLTSSRGGRFARTNVNELAPPLAYWHRLAGIWAGWVR